MLPTLLTPGAYDKAPDSIPVQYIVNDMLHRYTNNNENFFILESKTGSGKSTALMTYLRDNIFVHIQGNIVANLQPRVLSTESIPKDLHESNWNNVTLGDNLGFSHSMKSVIPNTGSMSLMYYTYGTFLYKFINEPDTTMLNHAALVLDEIHELTYEMIVLISKLKEYKRRLPLIILTSATIDTSKFHSYLIDETIERPIPIAEPYKVEGIQYPKYIHYLNSDNKNLTHDEVITDIVKNLIINENNKQDYIGSEYMVPAEEYELGYNQNISKDILIFVSSEAEIGKYKEKLKFDNTVVVGVSRKNILNNTLDYQIAIDPEYTGRRIIIGTNVVEVGVTLNDLGVVINLGWEQTMVYLGATTSALLSKPITNASYLQKIGRVGRKTKGLVFNIFSHEAHSLMKPTKDSIFEYSNICNILIASGRLDTKFIEPIDEYKLKIAKSELQMFNIFNDNELTEIGLIFQRLVIFFSHATLNDLYFLLFAWVCDHTQTLKDACAIISAINDPTLSKDTLLIDVLKKYNDSIKLYDDIKNSTIDQEHMLYMNFLNIINDIYGSYHTYTGVTLELDKLIELCYSTNIARSTVIINNRKIFNGLIKKK